MNRSIGTLARGARLAGICAITLSLSACVAAVVPLIAATGGAAGFSGYKLVQLANGASVHVGFMDPEGKERSVAPLSAGRRAAIWPGGEAEVRFAEQLSSSHAFDVIPPAKIAGILDAAKLGTKLNLLTTAEQAEAFSVVCRDAKADFVFAAQGVSTKKETNEFSFGRPTVTTLNDLMAYSCAQGAVSWRDRMTLVIEIGGKVPSDHELMQVLADAWADRMVQAQQAATTAQK